MKNKLLKKYLMELKNKLLLTNIWTYTKTYVSDNLGLGNIVEVIDYYKKNFTTCPPHSPIEYFEKDNVKKIFTVKTSKGNTLFITQYSYGLNFESPSDFERLIIQDSNYNILFDSYIHKELDIKKLKLDK
jgi:hypothetical protein